ncbi:hypothetical protein A9Q87_05790 [Flavobacteriales bacterium 34_180_T64]|nr:hypothetical protein A9Q87_05790 [Flavobacteriales bacterium 34_180_T64]
MKKITFKHVILFVLCTSLTSTISLAQEFLKEISLNEQVLSSTQIIEGKVISRTSFWDANHHNIYTANTVEVYKVFKGQSTLETIEVITSGGTVGLDNEEVTPSLELRDNDMGVFLLQDSTILLSSNSQLSRFKSNSSVQGFFKYNLINNSVSNPFVKHFGITSEFYNELMTLTNSGFINVNSISVDNLISQNQAFRGGSVINNFTPSSITAGTKSILTINGAGFGATNGTVGFRDSNDGGTSYFVALDSQIISWSNTQIQIEVPDRAGSGTIQVNGFITSGSSLAVPYAETNVESDAVSSGTFVAYQNRHVNDNASGGYTWQMQTDFDANASAKASFLRAFDSWICETGINWINGAVTTTDVVASDGINIIRFDNGAELPVGVLGRCTTRSSGCFINGGTSLAWYVSELDIQFNDTTNWNYGPSTPTFTQYDFESVAVHELGHGHQLVHVIDSNAIMHYSISNGDSNRVLGANDIAGAEDVQTRSNSSSVCSQTAMTDFDCNPLSVSDAILEENISMYPIPAKSSLFIKNASNTILKNAIIYDVRGQLISKIDLSESASLTEINVSQFASGVYFINIKSETASVTKKFIIE